MLKQCISIDSAKNLYAKPSQIQINDINNVIHKSISSAVNVSIHQQHNGIESGSVAQKPFALQIIDKKSFNSNECANNRIDHCQSLQFRHCTEKIGHRSSSICQCTNNVTKCCYRNAIKFSYIVYDMDTCAVNKLVSLLGCNLENFVRKMGEIDHGSVRCLLNNGMMTKCASITGSYCGIEMSTKCSSMSLSCASHIHQRVIGSGCVDANNLLKHCEHDDRIYGRIYIGPSMKAAGWFIDGILTVCNEQSTLPTLPPLLFSFKSRYTEDVAVAIVVAHGHHSDVSFLNDNYFIENRMRLSNTNAFINHKKSNANVDQIIFTSEHNNNRSAIDRVKYYGYTQNSKNIRNNDNLASVNMNNSQNDIDAATAMPKSHVSNVLPQTFEVNAISATQKTSKRFQIIRCTSYLVDAKKFLSALFLSLVFFCNLLPMSCAECDQTFVSRPGGPQNGTFAAPIINNMSNHSRQCLYIFLAGPGQRVEITFTSFNLRGSPPDGAAVGEIPSCGAEYMDIYSEVQSSDPADLINSPFGGRYCGPNLPRRRISLYRAIALSFFTNKNATSADLFSGRYSFINASIFEIGTPVTGSPCSFTITPHKNKSDVFISPTYPGTYPKDLSCTYHFIGESNQRVRLEFRDFDLFSGGPHCPFDYVKVYDGPDNSSDLIGTYCGQQRNLVLYSNESSLLVHFFTLRRTASTQNRGFKGIYEFSESFVKLDFIRENKGIHIRGSECDQKILSKRESTGLVYSPNYPYPYLPKTVCRYFIYGLQDAQHLERVRLEFQMFEIQKVTEHKDKDKESNCTDGYLKVFLIGQETQDAYDKFDYELCGQEIPHTVVSDGPRLAMVFSSGELQARGFKAKYTFETEYKIPGTAAPDGSCGFTYRSTSRKKGEFNSPRFPSKYISDTNCTYTFIPTPNEQVTIVFDHFKVKADNANVTNGGAYGVTACSEDWLEIYILFRDGNDRFIGRYCGSTSPGPVESPRLAVGIRIHLHTDAENVSSGFKGRYVFEVAKSDTGDCGGNSISGQESDVIMSPNYPGKYDGPGKGLASRACNWYINARPGYRVSMNFEFFSVEGDPPSRGCPAAALRIWTAPDSEQAPTELCGDKSPSENWHYISQGTQARINFVTTDKTIGAQGFRIVWTEVQDTTQLVGPPSSIVNHCEPISLFHCPISSYCISNKLRCDGMKNCGPDDESDEMNCPTEVTKDESEILIISSLAASSFLICLVCTIYHRRKRRKHHHRQLGLHRSGGHYDSTTSATGLGSSRRHLQSGNSLSGSLHYGINSDDDILPIPQPPLPPTSVPPHLNHLITNCTEDPMHGMDDDDDEEDTDLDSELPSMSMHINHQHHSSKFAIRNIETH